MAGSAFHDKFAIVGLGQTEQGRLPGKSGRALEVEAARLAIEDAGLKPRDIDGYIHLMLSGAPGTHMEWVDAAPRVMGLPIKFYFGMARGGATSPLAIMAAAKYLELGIAKYVLISYAMNEWSRMHVLPDKMTAQSRRFSGVRDPLAGQMTASYREKEGNWGPEFGQFDAVHMHSFLATRHMHEYGTTSRQFGAIAVAQRQWACLNPAAIYRKPITIEDHQASPIISWPYHRLDCCQINDGGTAFILTTADRAKDLRKPPVYAMGIGFGEQMEELYPEKKNYTTFAVRSAKEAAFREAGIGLEDIDVAQIYDCFTAEVLIALEDYGWCKKGEGGAFVEGGHIGPGGSLPLNTGGGLLSSFYQGDTTPLSEAVIQLRGEGGARQVKDAEICLVTGHGGELLTPGLCATHTSLILRR